MSFVHNVRVGFFGVPQEHIPARQFSADECVQLLRRYNECAPENLRVLVEPAVHGTANRGMVLGSVDGFPIVLKGGILICPYLATGYVAGAVCFVAFLHKLVGCSIYSDDEGKFLSLEEFVPDVSFSSVIQTVMQQQNEKEAAARSA